MNEVIIVVPIYNEKLTTLEQISLQQLFKVLGKYKIVFMAPQGLAFTYNNNCEVISFPNEFFVSKETYSDLLMTVNFYETFIEYKYLLIYQLDAFVFSDKLQYFCDLGYDYIGAPLIGPDWRLFHVGNGGFSLRNIGKSLKMIRQKEAIIKKMFSLMQFESFAEDVFFSYCGYDNAYDYTVPTARLAATFSAEFDYAHGLRDISKRDLPFGCHYWETLNFEFWRSYIEGFGYKLPNVKPYDTLNDDRKRRARYLMRRYLRWQDNCNKRNTCLLDILTKRNMCSIYGAGIWGERTVRFIKKLRDEIPVDCIYDKNRTGDIEGIPIVIPKREVLKNKNCLVIVAAPNYEKEISADLIDMGLVEGEDFISIIKVMHDHYRLRMV